MKKSLHGKRLWPSLLMLVMVLCLGMSTANGQKQMKDQLSDQPNFRSGVQYNYKEIAKQADPGLDITGKYDNPFLRAEYYENRLRDPRTGKIPENIREKELQYIRSSRAGLQREFNSLLVNNPDITAAGDIVSPWIRRGPFNVGGRTRALAIDRTDENIVFAGGVSGGLWRSTDQGVTWTRITPAEEHPSVTDIVQDPRVGFENIWYYATGERIGNSASDDGAFFAGNGVYKSIDGGLTWQVLAATENTTPGTFSSADPFDLIFGVDVHPTTGDLYVATFVGIYRSTDGGLTFEEVITADFDNTSDIHITSTGVLYATLDSGAPDAGLFRSTDGAPGTWVNITPPGFPAAFNRTVITTAPSDEDILYLLSVTPGSGTLGMNFWKYTYVSGDGTGAGGVWEDRSANIPALGGLSSFNPQGGYNLVVRVFPTNPDIVFIGGTNIYRSLDGFATAIGADDLIGGYNTSNDFILYTDHHPDQHGMEFIPSNPNRVITSHDGGVSITDDILATLSGGPFGNEPVDWTSLNNGYLTTQAYAISIGPGDQLMAGFQDNSTYFTNTTTTTNPWTLVSGADGSYNAFNSDGTFRYVSFQNGTTFRQQYANANSDVPLTFDQITPAGASGFLFVNPFEMDPNDDRIIYMAAGGFVWRNDDLPNATSVAGWTQISNAASPGGTVSAIGISANPANTVYYGTTAGSVVRIDNANVGNPTGTDVTGANFPTGANVTSVDVSPIDDNDVIVTFSNYGVQSIFQSLDGGATWTDVSGNLEENPDGSGDGPSVRWVTRVGVNDRYFAATSTGLYSTTTLNGASTTWVQEDPSGVGNVVIEQIRVRNTDGLVVLGTHGNGMYSANFEVSQPSVIVANPLANVEVEVNSAPTVIDVSNVFQSTTTPPSTLTLSVANNNTGLVDATLVGTDLTLTYTPDEFGEASITLTASDGTFDASNAFTVTVNPPPLIISDFPYLETFENGELGPGSLPRDWEVASDPGPPYEWTVDNGGTASPATGPLVDHTTGTTNGFYVYTEASGGFPGDVTELVSPPVVISSLNNPAFEFWYHLFGAEIVSFEVDVIDEVNDVTTTVFSRDGQVQANQTDPYLLQIIPLTGFGDTIRVVFRGTRGGTNNVDGFQGDITIDDVRFFEAPVVAVVGSPDSLFQELPQGQTATQTLTLTNISGNDVTYDISIEDADAGMTIRPVTLTGRSANEPLVRRTVPFQGQEIGLNSFSSIPGDFAIEAVTQYGTDFEAFLLGDVNGQDGWIGQFGNWTIENLNPGDGSQHFRGLADGFGQSLAFTPSVPIGSDPISSVSLMVNLQGLGVTWDIIPQSETTEFVNTRLRFNPDGSMSALVSDGLGGGAFQDIGMAVPSGYFRIDIEVERATSQFTIYIDGTPVFSELGFAGDIENVAIFSLMEIAGPTLDIDNIQILDGAPDRGTPFLSVDPLTGTIPAGSSIDLAVTFDSNDQDFGTFTSNIIATINNGDIEPVITPATLRVFGDPAIAVSPTVIEETVDFNKMSTRTLSIENTGGNPLQFDLTVLGADVDGMETAEIQSLMSAPAQEQVFDARVTQKLAQDNKLSANLTPAEDQLFLVVGETFFNEDFEGGIFPPNGWSVVDNEGTGVVWGFAADYSEGNYSGSGEAATVSSDAFGAAEFDTELWTPVIDIAGKSNLVLQYNVNYQNFAGLDFLDLDISTDGGTTWTTMLSWNEDHGTFRGTPGEQVSLDLDPFVDGATQAIIRWRYYDPNTDDFDWYAQIDDVEIIENSTVWLAVNQPSGVVGVGETAEIDVIFDATVVDPGFYVAGIVVNSNASNTPQVGVVAAMTVLNPAEISVSPESLEEELVSGLTSTQNLTISNSGESDLDFVFDGFGGTLEVVNTNELAPRDVIIRSEAFTGDKLDFSRPDLITLDGVFASATELYATGFEAFATGDIDGQDGWIGQFGNWTIETVNPSDGSQHFRGLADGLGQTISLTPAVAIGTEPVSSTIMEVAIDGTGVTWIIAPQSNTSGSVVTNFQVLPDGSIQTLVDGATGGEFVPVTAPLPTGYFELRFDVVRATSEFTIYFDGEEVFSGQGFTGDIEQVAIVSLMEEAGPTLDIDNIGIFDGEVSQSFLTVTPAAGSLGTGESIDIVVGFDATELVGGVYEEVLSISNNDPVSPVVEVPVTLTVIDPPILSVEPDTLRASVNAGQSVSESFTISNLGVAELNYTVNVQGGIILNAVPGDLPTFKNWKADQNIMTKLEGDNELQPRQLEVSSPVGFSIEGSVALLFEDFEDGVFPPADWNVVDNEGTGVVWGFAADYGEGNYAGTGEAATVSSDAFGTAEFDTELWTPSIAVNGNTGIMLQYLVNYQNFAGLDFLDVDISTNDGATWTNVLSWNEDHGSFFATPGEVVSLNLDPYLVGATEFIIRWRYYDPNTGDFDWYAQIDDVFIGVPWISADPISGTIPGGSSDEIEVEFNASALSAGTYFAELVVNSNDLVNPTETVLAELSVNELVYRVNAGYWRDVNDDPINWDRDSKKHPSPYVNSDQIGFASADGLTGILPRGLFRKSRVNNSNQMMQWDFPVSDGNYKVTLHFVEPSFTSREVGDRVFDVLIEGATALDDFDIIAFKGKGALASFGFNVLVTDGNLDVDFINEVGGALISGIEIEALGAFETPDNDPNLYFTAQTVGEIEINEGAQATLAVRATDFDGDPITLIYTPEPGLSTFSQITDNGDGTGTITFNPGYDDLGDYTFGIVASDGDVDLYSEDSQTFVAPLVIVNDSPEGTPLYRVNAGDWREVMGTPNNWTIDNAASPSPYVNSDMINFNNASHGMATNATDAPDAVFNNSRVNLTGAAMQWDFPVAMGRYDVKLYFIESGSGLGERLFNVEIEGNAALTNFDIYAEAGGLNIAVQQTFTVMVTDGNLDINFANVARSASIAAIEVTFNSELGSGSETGVVQLESLENTVTTPKGVIGAVDAYPNPLEDKLTVTLPEAVSDMVKVQIIDVQGRLYYEGEHFSAQERVQATFNLGKADIPNGVYILRITAQDRSPWTLKVLKD